MNADMTPGQLLFALGVMGYHIPTRDSLDGSSITAERTFDRIVDLAKTRGFKDRRSLLGGVRRGKPTPGMMAKANAACALLKEHEFRAELGTADWWERTIGRGAWCPNVVFRTAAPGPVESDSTHPDGRCAALATTIAATAAI